MDFNLTPEVDETRQAIRRFVADNLLPLESDPASFDDHENIRLDLLDKMREKAKAQGLWSLSMPTERGGRAFDRVGMTDLLEAFGYG